jgi:integrase
MATTKLRFTKAALEKISPPVQPKKASGGVYDSYRDEVEPGLVLLVSHGGAKTFYLYAKIEGRPERIRIARFPDLSIDAARQKARAIKGEIARGENPNQRKRQMKAEITFGEMFNEFMERYAKIEKKSWKYDEREVPKFVAHWFPRKASSIMKDEVRRLHDTIRTRSGLYQANRLLERVRAIYNKAHAWGWPHPNPTDGIKKFKEQARDRFLQPSELPKFFAALQAEPNETIRDFIWISLFTGARKSNVLSMRWRDIDFGNALWHIPDTKSGEPVTLPLVSVALEVLQRRQRTATSEFVFPSERSASGHLADPKRAWTRIREAAGIEDLRLHDLRRTLGSYQALNNASLEIIGKSLGHKSQRSTQIYARLHTDPVRRSIEQATKTMLDNIEAE